MSLASILATASTTATTVATKSKSSGSILDPIAKPIADFLAAIYAIVPNYGVAIIILSITWMVIIAPLTLKSTRSMLAMQQLQPKLKKLQEQHKDDRQAFAAAQMELFREHNVSPFGSCLPMLLPLPIFFALYRVITGLSHTTNGVPTPKYIPPSSEMYHNIVASGGQLYAFGMNLSKSAIASHSSFGSALPYWIMLGLMGATSYFQSSQMMSRNPAAAANPQARMMRFLPLIFVVFCFRFPAGVVLYYTVSNLCRIAQQDLMYRFDPKVKALVAKEVIEVEEITKEIDDRKKTGPDASGSTPAKPAPAAGAAPGGRPSFREMWAQAIQPQQRNQAKPTGGSPPKNQPAKGAPPKSTSAKAQPAQKSQPAQKAQPAQKTQGTQKKQGTQKNQAAPKSQAAPKAQPAQKSQPAQKAQPAQKTQGTQKKQGTQRNQAAPKAQPAQKPPGADPTSAPVSDTTNGTGGQTTNGSSGNGSSHEDPSDSGRNPRGNR